KGRLKQRLAVRQFLNLVPGNVEEALDLIALALGLATILAQALEGQVSVRGGTHFLLALRDAVRRSGEGADDLPALFALARVFAGAFQLGHDRLRIGAAPLDRGLREQIMPV